MLTCLIRYEVNPEKLVEFEKYGLIWIKLVNELGGIHHGYFLPNLDPEAQAQREFSFSGGMGRAGSQSIGIAMFSFPSWEEYEKYRHEAPSRSECDEAAQILHESKCFTSYERTFLKRVAIVQTA